MIIAGSYYFVLLLITTLVLSPYSLRLFSDTRYMDSFVAMSDSIFPVQNDSSIVYEGLFIQTQ